MIWKYDSHTNTHTLHHNDKYRGMVHQSSTIEGAHYIYVITSDEDLKIFLNHMTLEEAKQFMERAATLNKTREEWDNFSHECILNRVKVL